MTTPVLTPFRSGQRPGRDGFAQLLRAEWTKFRTVRGWVVGMVAAAGLTALATVALAGTAQNNNSLPSVATGPAGDAVTDTFYFVHQPLAGSGSMTVRVTSLTGSAAIPPVAGSAHVVQPWAKTGIIIKASTRPGAAYAAMMVTGGHGVRMQYDFTGDVAGLPGAVSAASPRWLRLTRTGDAIAGYDSADGRHWTKVGTVRLTGLPSTVQAGLFATSPPALQVRQTFGSDSGISFGTVDRGVFDHVSLQSGLPGHAWSGAAIGEAGARGTVSRLHCPPGTPCPGPPPPAGFTESAGTFTVAGSGDIAPYVPIVDPLGVTFKGSLIGLVAMIALGALFITSEYRRGMIRTTLAASPRRGRVLVAKAIVVGSVTFVAGLAGAAAAFPIAEQKLRSNGWITPIYPVRSLISGIGLQVVVGTAALLAVGAVLALAIGAVLRRSAGAIGAAIVLLIFPLILATVLPMTPAQWLLRLTPAAAFSLQQATVRYQQVSSSCLPYHGCYPLAPWYGFAVLCAWAVAGLGIAVYLLRRRDA
jgi:ABC-2 family transporter protein